MCGPTETQQSILITNAITAVKLANNLNLVPSCLLVYAGDRRSGHGHEETCTVVVTLVLGCYISAA